MAEFFLRILNMSITAGIVTLAVIVLRLPLKRAPKWISCSLWAVVLFRLICPFSFSLEFSLLRGIGVPAAESGVISYFPAVIASNTAGDTAASSFSMAMDSPVTQATPVAGTSFMQMVIIVGMCIWFAGLAAMLLYSAISYSRIKRKVSDAVMIDKNIFETDAIDSPFVWGIFRPRIYLPVGLAVAERQYILRHEQTHIRRRDYIIKPFAFLVLSVHWFNPLIWLAFRLMSLDMEMSCDESVIRGLDRKKTADYSAALLHFKANRPILVASQLAFGEDSASERIKNVINYKKPTLWVIVIAVIICAAAAVLLLANPVGTDEYRSMKKDAVYLNGFYILTDKIVNADGSVSATFTNGLKYYDGWIEGEIAVTENLGTDYSQYSDLGRWDALSDIMESKYTFTWNYKMGEHEVERNVMTHGTSMRTGDDGTVTYGKTLYEYLAAGEEDALVCVYVTGIDAPLQFIIPAAGTAPEGRMLYGTFSPVDVVYLSPDISADASTFLANAEGTLFTVSPDEFSVSGSKSEIIGSAYYKQPGFRGGLVEDTLETEYSGLNEDEKTDTIDVSEYNFKIRYWAYDSRFKNDQGYYFVLLMDDETWVGRWNLYGTDDSEVRCDYIFRVETVAALEE